jgi:hypothetical protein
MKPNKADINLNLNYIKKLLNKIIFMIHIQLIEQLEHERPLDCGLMKSNFSIITNTFELENYFCNYVFHFFKVYFY